MYIDRLEYILSISADTLCLKRAPEQPLQRGLLPMVSRWWLREVKHDKSIGEGYYEVLTGLVAMWANSEFQAIRTHRH